MEKSIAVMLTAIVEDETTAVEVGEQFARTAIGLGLRGIYCSLSLAQPEEEDED